MSIVRVDMALVAAQAAIAGGLLAVALVAALAAAAVEVPVAVAAVAAVGVGVGVKETGVNTWLKFVNSTRFLVNDSF